LKWVLGDNMNIGNVQNADMRDYSNQTLSVGSHPSNLMKFVSSFLPLFIFAFCIAVFPANAQYGPPGGGGQYGGPPPAKPVEFGEHYKHDISYEVKSHDEKLMGEEIDLDTGALSFFHTDVSLPGNFDIPVSFGRHISPKSEQEGWIGGWASSLPEILLRTRNNWSNPGKVCSSPQADAAPSNIGVQMYFNGKRQTLSFYHEPHGTSWTTMPLPGARTQPKYLTADMWRIDCISSANTAGEGFKAIAPNGTTYVFDRMYGYDDGVFSGAYGPRLYGIDSHRADMLVFQVTSVTDKHGNAVTYSYNSSNRPTKISASDGRQITFGYTSGKLSTVSAHGRVWTYRYNSQRPYSLKEVELPDGRKWGLGKSISRYGHRASRYGLSESNTSAVLTHPDGTKGVYWLNRIEHGRTRVPPHAASMRKKYCQRLAPHDVPRPEYHWSFCSMGITTKKLVLSSGEELIWKHSYDKKLNMMGTVIGLWNQLADSDLKTTTIIDPKGHKSEYDFVRAWGWMEGLVAETRQYKDSSSTTPLKTTNNRWVPLSVAGKATTSSKNAFWGASPFVIKLEKETTSVDGDVYTMDATYNVYGHKLTHLTSSNVSTARRGTRNTYIYDFANWRHPQLDKVFQVGGQSERQVRDYDYNPMGDKSNETLFERQNASYIYHPTGELKSIKDALGRTVTLSNYYRGVPRTVARPDNVSLLREVNNFGQVTSQTDAMKRKTNYTYNSVGRLTKIDPTGTYWANTDISYSNLSSGGLVQTITKGQSKTTITYDSMLRSVLERTQALDTGWSSYTNTKYDGLGRVTFKSQPSTNPNETKGVDHTYDGLGRIYDIRENVAPYAKTKHRYYSSHRHRVYDPSGAFTQYYSYGYDGPGSKDYRAIYRHDGSKWLQYNYLYKNIWGQLTRLRQWGNVNGYSGDKSQYFYYDSNQRLCRHYVPEHGATKYQYDVAGQMTAYAKGQANSGCGIVPNVSAKVSQSYDILGRLKVTKFTDPATADISYTYDANGNTKTVRRDGVNWNYMYNDADLLTHEYLDVDGRDYDSIYYYNNTGHITRKRLNFEGSPIRNVYYAPDGLGRSKTVKNGAALMASATSFHPNGSLAGMTYGNGQRFTQTLNARLLPHRLLSFKGGSKAIDQTFAYDARGKVNSIIDGAVSGNNRIYDYDGLGRLTSATGPWGTGSFKYDPLDNLRQKKLGSRTVNLSYDSRNRLSQSADTGSSGTRAVGYDVQGNVTSLGNLAFIYDYSDQPVVVNGTANGVGSANGAYTYDGNLKRVKSVVNGRTIYNIYDASGRLVHIDAVTDNKKTDYVSGPNGTLARITNNVVTYLHPDHLGSAQSGTNSSGAIAWRERYTPFGEELVGPAANDNLGGFTGHIKDKATGLNYMQARYYDPVIGRFLSIDPVTFGMTVDPRSQ